jgi:hypothetical protein
MDKMSDIKAFMQWIEDEVNPERKRNGLPVIQYNEQIMCYEILEAFSTKMQREARLEGYGGGN